MKNLLIIGHTFPEPVTTAAGNRMMQLMTLFKEDNYRITFATTASKTEYSEELENRNITMKSILLNDTSFDAFISDLSPEVVLFDRYVTEEQFGWRVSQNCPHALRILDTEDLHFLRKAREEAFKKQAAVNLYSEIAKRELASILRSDLSLIISIEEMKLLKNSFSIPDGILYYLPLFTDFASEETPPFEERQHFISIGNFQHAPNLDAVKYLKEDIWLKIRKELPEAQLHIYGAYAPKHISDLHNEKEGFLIKGWAEDVEKVMQQAKVCLAPLRFGAGLKGKLLDAAQHGTPSVTTTIGAEGLFTIACEVQTTSDFVAASVQLYTQKAAWVKQQKEAFRVLKNHFKNTDFSEDFKKQIAHLQQSLFNHRQTHFLGQVLQHQSLQATKFMSKWIEEKNKK